jgi:hypothetical protein
MGNRTIKINEDNERQIIQDILAESYYPTGEKVLTIKNYLDGNFQRIQSDDIDEKGYPKKVNCVMLMSGNQALKPMTMSELLLMLDDKFIKMISDKSDRRKFLKQVIKDWYDNKIDRNGVLSVNFV